MRREFQLRFPRGRGLAIPTCITAPRNRKLAISFEVGGGKHVSAIPRA